MQLSFEGMLVDSSLSVTVLYSFFRLFSCIANELMKQQQLLFLLLILVILQIIFEFV